MKLYNYSGSNLEIDDMLQEESSDDDILVLAREWFRVQLNAPTPFVFTEVLGINNTDVSLNSFALFFDEQLI